MDVGAISNKNNLKNRVAVFEMPAFAFFFFFFFLKSSRNDYRESVG